MINFILGIIVGLLLSVISYFGTRRAYDSPHIQRFLNTSGLINPKQKVYIAGLSDEEQSFQDNLPNKI